MKGIARAAIGVALLAIGGVEAAAATPPGAPPATFTSASSRVTNRWFPLAPGTAATYRGVKDGKPAVDIVTVTRATKSILGVRTRVVHDRLYVQGKLAEVTQDWYAQDRRGNVWYFGEATKTLTRKGRIESTEGSFQAGVDGARAGIYMPARPRVGQSGRQEYYKGHAEDRFTILALNVAVAVPAVSSTAALETRETTPLEPGVVDHKYYVSGMGTVSERTVRGGRERLELVSVTRR
jgi:hypothetical protein